MVPRRLLEKSLHFLLISIEYSPIFTMSLTFPSTSSEDISSRDQEAQYPVTNEKVLKEVHMVVAGDTKMQEAWHKTQLYAKAQMTMLYRGERGTGKELFPKAVHQLNGNNSKYVAVNCAGLNDGVVESELFGHEKGSFTDARTTRDGAFGTIADGGTIFLDEVGDMPLNQQAKLLRVLETREFSRVGSNETKKLSPKSKIIAATNRDLEQLVGEGKFRSDLYDRLRSCQIFIPALRERHIDHKKLLIAHFLKSFAATDYSMQIDPKAEEYLLHQEYAGNVRELRDHILRACFISQSTAPADARILTVSLEHIHLSSDPSFIKKITTGNNGDPHYSESFLQGTVRVKPPENSTAPHAPIQLVVNLEGIDGNLNAVMTAIEIRLLQLMMERYDDNQSTVSNITGLTRGTVRKKLNMGDLLNPTITPPESR